MNNQDFNNWKMLNCTESLFTFIEKKKSEIKESMLDPNNIVPEDGKNGYHKLLRLLGVLEGLEHINTVTYDDLKDNNLNQE